MGSYIRMAESLLYSCKTNTTLLISYTPTQKKKLKRKKELGNHDIPINVLRALKIPRATLLLQSQHTNPRPLLTW